jgi:hypothetical protein
MAEKLKYMKKHVVFFVVMVLLGVGLYGQQAAQQQQAAQVPERMLPPAWEELTSGDFALAVERAGGKPPLLLVVASHGVFYPSLIAALSPEGKVLREYWHSGHINALAATDLDQDSKPELYLFANHNPSKSFSVIALDPEDFGGASKESNPDYQLLNLGEARELGRIVIPRSEMTRQLGDLGNPGGLNVQSGRLVIQALQTSSRPDLEYQPGVLYQFGPRLELAGIEYAWTYRSMYDQLVRTAKIKPYDLDADLERMRRQIEVVTPWRAGGQK